eukprot:TRINITY_DN16548_c0_g1_i1.p1 TRINITY_DN16548_c0_g1~~TRINITY_DN16548_c0_g1_i1.p1  ORF type:complete len:361 (+),score=84.30 TRINITY_DN16548_c0_g1_i1:57-1085(+)
MDALYGSLPAPHFRQPDGTLMPDVMMKSSPSFLWFGGLLTMWAVCGCSHAGGLEVTVVALPVLVHWVLFLVHGWPCKSEKLFDVAGQLAFTSMALLSYSRSSCSAHQFRVTACCVLWSVRLGLHLQYRILRRGTDVRHTEGRKHAGYFFFTWTCQGVWCVPIGLPLLLLHSAGTAGASVTTVEAVGMAVWAAGLLIETVADLQKLKFVESYPPGMPRRWIDEGLWRYSRHPNFFGETLVWLGVFIMCTTGLSWVHTLAAAVSPLFAVVFLMQTSLPWLEVLADRQHGRSEAYLQYKASTSAFAILPLRSAAADRVERIRRDIFQGEPLREPSTRRSPPCMRY